MELSFAICSNTKTYHLGQDSRWLLFFWPVSVQDVLEDEVTTTCTHAQHKQTVADMTNKTLYHVKNKTLQTPNIHILYIYMELVQAQQCDTKLISSRI